MDINEYINKVADRHKTLSDEEKETVRRTVGTPVGSIITKLLPELRQAVTIGKPTESEPKRSGLGSR